MSRGVNVYEEMRGVFGFANEAEKLENRSRFGGPCIFLSHKSEDKEGVRAIADYIMAAGIDIYLDADDSELQKADREGDDAKVTLFIERGIRCSTDVMALVSERTKGSWWVPYELGFGKRDAKRLVCLRLKDVTNLPSYLKIVDSLRDIQDLNYYLRHVHGRKRGSTPIKEAEGWLATIKSDR